MKKEVVVDGSSIFMATCLSDNIPQDPMFILMKENVHKGSEIKYESSDNYNATYCKETLINIFRKTRGSWDIKNTCVGIIKTVPKKKKDINRIKRRYKKAIQIVNMLEKKYNWPLSTMELFTYSQIQKKAQSSSEEKRSNSRDSTFLLGIFKPSPVWYQYNHTLSLYLSFIRLSINGAYSNVASYNMFLKRNEKLKKQAISNLKNDTYPEGSLERETMHVTFSNVWPIFLKYMDNLYDSKNIKDFETGQELFTIGIDTFITKFWREAIRQGKSSLLKSKGLFFETPKYSSEKDVIVFDCPDRSNASKKLLTFVTTK